MSQQVSAQGLGAELPHPELLSVWTKTTSEYVIENRPSSVTAVVAHVRTTLQNLEFGDKSLIVRICGAFSESLDNALYHGNLELSSELRTGNDSAWHAAIMQRRQTPPYRDRRVFVAVEISKIEVRITIEDEGPGFDHTRLPDPTEACNLERSSGRGLFLIRSLMDEVHYNERGNQVTLVKRTQR